MSCCAAARKQIVDSCPMFIQRDRKSPAAGVIVKDATDYAVGTDGTDLTAE